ncbi:hypothetical protein OSB04_009641 [Centaurea solstitialis]|uniref:Uncharacterized protein n=1 Tax=Centaurea solstitialis TaxID=347529 RepID=A0AA38TP23_9ASTR|nr:hypothetical protein OSB04_009641 [Centaurea solstitialis]
MRISALLLLLLFFFLSTTPPSMAEIKSLKIRSDNRPMILFEKFGFTHTGFVPSRSPPCRYVDVVAARSVAPRESQIQVLLELQQNPNFCVVDSKFISLLFTFRDLSPPPQSSFNKSYPVTYPNEYSLFFANCNPQSLVTMDVHTELYNTETETPKDYLSAGMTQLPSLYFIFSLVYLCFLGFWISICFKNKRSVHRIHLLMGGLLVMKALNLICAAEDKHYVKVTGTPHGWDVLFYIFQFIRVVLLFTVIVLIGTGWSFLKPFLQEKEKKVLMIVIPLQVLANVASIVIGETGPFIKDWVTWNQVFLLVDIICCCAIIFPIVWSIRSLRETSKTDGKAARNLAKLTLFRQFYIVTIAAYKYQWVSNAAEEIASQLRKNEYFVLDDEDEEAAEMALRDEEFDGHIFEALCLHISNRVIHDFSCHLWRQKIQST